MQINWALAIYIWHQSDMIHQIMHKCTDFHALQFFFRKTHSAPQNESYLSYLISNAANTAPLFLPVSGAHHPVPRRPFEWPQQMPASSHSDCLVLQV